ncbi:MAG: hypothetical protein IJR83_05840 [Clostridia bacterium]|nr:hypothetical protein [Clostridia bacterium]
MSRFALIGDNPIHQYKLEMIVIQGCVSGDGECLFSRLLMCANECQGNTKDNGGGDHTCNSQCAYSSLSIASVFGGGRKKMIELPSSIKKAICKKKILRILLFLLSTTMITMIIILWGNMMFPFPENLVVFKYVCYAVLLILPIFFTRIYLVFTDTSYTGESSPNLCVNSFRHEMQKAA